MNKLSRTLLLAGALVLALLVGVLIGRGQHSVPNSEGNGQAMMITTAPPPAIPAATPLPAPVQAPRAVAIPKIAPSLQVQEDAAAVGMTTQDGDDQTSGDTAPAPAPKTTAAAPDNASTPPT
jgi:hypothetical protein